MNRFFLLFGLLAVAGTVAARPTPASIFSHPFFQFFSESSEPLIQPDSTVLPLTITCPPNDTVDITMAQCSVIYTFTITVSDPNALWAQTAGLPSGSAYYPGVTTNSFIAIDQGGTTATCSFTVSVRTPTVPLVCNDLAVWLDSACTYTVSSGEVLDPSVNLCLNSLITEVDRVPPFNGNGPWTPPVMGVIDLGKTYQIRVTDPFSGNRCWSNVTVADSVRPVISCSTIVVPCSLPTTALTPEYLRDSLGFTTAWPTASDNCGGTLNITFADSPQNLPCDTSSDLAARIVRVWSARDVSNNFSSCTQHIERRRLIGQVLMPAASATSCAAPNLSSLVHGQPYYQINGRRFDVTALPLCELEANYYDTLQALCGGAKRVKRTWKVFDLCRPLSAANPHIGLQFIDQLDTVGPALVCPAQVTIVQAAPACSITLGLPEVPLSDACSTPTSVAAFWTIDGLTDSQPGTISGSAGQFTARFDSIAGFPIGETLVYYTATDDCGSVGTCSFTVIVHDALPPVALCDSLLTVTLDSLGQASLSAAAFDNGSSDACGDVVFRVRPALATSCRDTAGFYQAVDFCCADAGDTLAFTLRVYDISTPSGIVADSFGTGQFADCLTRVRVVDTLPPGCVAPVDVSIYCYEFDSTLIAYDGQGLQTSCSVDSVLVTVDYAQFDTTCRAGTLLRSYTVFDAGGQSSSCLQTINVAPYQGYFIKFPNDVVLTVCGANGPDGGGPELGNVTCEDFEITYTDELFPLVPDACYKIERTWRIINRCSYTPGLALIAVPNPTPLPNSLDPANFIGPIVSLPGTAAPWQPTVVRVYPTQPLPTDYSQFWSISANGYEYKQIIRVIDQQNPVVECPASPPEYCDLTSNDPLLWNDLDWFDPANNSHDLCEGPTDLTIDAVDLCSGADVTVTFQLFLDLDSDGAQETVVASNQPTTMTPGFVRFGNLNTPNFQGGTLQQFDFRPVPSSQYYRFGLQTDTVGGQLRASVRWFTQPNNPDTIPNPAQGIIPQLPYGNHKMKWFISDGCGNTTICQYDFSVKDCKNPIVVCINGLSANILSTQSVTLYATDFFLYAEDNCTPAPMLQIGIRKSGTGTGFPFNAFGAPINSVTFGCDELGTNFVEIWALDAAGNAGFCETFLLLQDNGQYCDSASSVNHRITTELELGVKDVEIEFSSAPPGLPPISIFGIFTDSLGEYSISNAFPLSNNITVTPRKDINPQNGVSTFDLLLISRHILGLEPLSTPYKQIAADANRSNSVTTFDIVELRKLLLGIYSELPNNTSWRFVPAAYVFPNPDNPFAAAFPEEITGQGATGDFDFIGIKIGDVNISGNPQQLTGVDDRAAPRLELLLTDRQLGAGEVVEVPVRAAQPTPGFQATLETGELELLDVLPGAATDREHFGLFPHRLTASWNTVLPDGAQPGFTLRLRARHDGLLSRQLRLSDAVTPTECYDADGRTGPVTLRFSAEGLPTDRQLELYQNVPNPFQSGTSIGFYLPGATPVVLTVYNAAGQPAFRTAGDFTAGEHFIKIEAEMLGNSGLYFYKLETQTATVIRKMEKSY